MHVKTGILIPLLTWLASCAQPANDYSSPKGYQLTNPEKWLMPGSLNEISGIAFNNGDAGILYAQQDEDGRIYYLKPGDTKASFSTFGKKGDYEDVAIINGTIILLRSDGTLYSFPVTEIGQASISNVTEWKDLVPKAEYEGLFADATGNNIYVLCKSCKGEMSGQQGYGFILQLDSLNRIVPASGFQVNVPPFSSPVTNKPVPFQPSALAKHPQTNEWYILSSVNNVLIVTNSNWEVQEIHRLSPALFNQPEGIAFDSAGNLYISNEGSKEKQPNVLKFAYSGTEAQ